MAYKVLVVDDQALPRQLFENLINASEKYELVACLDSARVLDLYCAREEVDLIILDVVMHDGVNGFEAAKKIKASYPKTKIIMMTSMADVRFMEKAKEIGIESFWYKEVQDEPMLSVMDRTMAGENVYPDRTPAVKLGLADSSEFTNRELEVLSKLVKGFTDKEIAEELFISYHTARFHVNSLLEKTGCTSRTQLAIFAAQSGIVVPDI